MNKYEKLDIIYDEYSKLMEFIFLIGEYPQELTKNNKWISNIDVEAFAAKLFNHLGTILCLVSKKTSFQFSNEKQERIYIDFISILVIVRAAFETYLTFYYLFCDININKNSQLLRYHSWLISGFLDRQNFQLDRSKEIASKLEHEKTKIIELELKIENNPAFQKFTDKIKKNIKKGQWRQKYSWADLAEIAGFNKIIFKDLYGYLCSYSHSGSLSIFQIRDAYTLEVQSNLTHIPIYLGLIIMTHFSKNHMKLYHNSKKILKQKKQIEPLLYKWSMTLEGFLNSYRNKK